MINERKIYDDNDNNDDNDDGKGIEYCMKP